MINPFLQELVVFRQRVSIVNDVEIQTREHTRILLVLSEKSEVP